MRHDVTSLRLLAALTAALGAATVTAAAFDVPIAAVAAGTGAAIGTGVILAARRMDRSAAGPTSSANRAAVRSAREGQRARVRGDVLKARIRSEVRSLRGLLTDHRGVIATLQHSEPSPLQHTGLRTLDHSTDRAIRKLDEIASLAFDQPLSRADAAHDVRRDEPPADRAPRPGHGRHILIVDDNDVNRLVVRRLLERMNYTTEEARNGQEAVDQASQTAFAAILMDLQMPVLDGFEATRQIRRRLAERAPPVIALTANVLALDQQQARECGMVEHLGKPLDRSELTRALDRWTTSSAA